MRPELIPAIEVWLAAYSTARCPLLPQRGSNPPLVRGEIPIIRAAHLTDR